MLRTESITHRYGEGSAAVTVLDNVSINIPKGDSHQLLGAPAQENQPCLASYQACYALIMERSISRTAK